MLNIDKIPNSPIYRIYWNTKYLGTFEIEVDGFYYFWPDEMLNGFWSNYMLREIANKLDELNKDWNNKINKDLSGDTRTGTGTSES